MLNTHPVILKELNAGDIYYLKEGCEHVAYPQGERGSVQEKTPNWGLL
jgi:hypothetical protein